jgi:hypothetical protein
MKRTDTHALILSFGENLPLKKAESIMEANEKEIIICLPYIVKDIIDLAV